MRTVWLPSLGVLARRTVGKLNPPSVESEILTLAVLIGAAVVLATFQVTLKFVFPGMLTFVFGAVTTNGPAPLLTLKMDVAELIPPPLARLSRATTAKVILRVMAGSNSPVRQAAVGQEPLVEGGTLALFKIY